MSPYIVTTKRPYVPDPDRGDAPASAYEPIVVSSVATARREKAQQIVEDYVDEFEFPWPDEAPYPMREQGGTVGPLPDGTVIEVERVTWSVLASDVTDGASLAELAGYGHTEPQQQILDTYNARQA